MNTLYKPNGKEVQVSDTSFAHALSLGWTEKKPTKKKVKTPKAD